MTELNKLNSSLKANQKLTKSKIFNRNVFSKILNKKKSKKNDKKKSKK